MILIDTDDARAWCARMVAQEQPRAKVKPAVGFLGGSVPVPEGKRATAVSSKRILVPEFSRRIDRQQPRMEGEL